MIKAAFLDRDGVINHDLSYIGRPEDFLLIAGVPEALRMLRDAGYALIVVTNQSGIGRGYYSESDYWRVTDRMRALLSDEGIEFAAILHCPHAPDDGCECRKPMPGMLLDGAAHVGAAPDESVLFGDKPSDIAAGRSAGVTRCFLIGEPGSAALCGADGDGADLLSCVRQVLAAR
ncbi:HAD family hydrolase [uncultured Sphingomonas sp.]|uniref:D-glycero-alpha-D-manno-heptose-1,7-bisphosphate 7-phosphatase n=1 Tax=uncultured Sphingomonas sp. TaxID=158754 RepID=UPI00261F3EFC|nr:HAD family hydrolase [uncultured Sphingomonas sp.]